MYIRMYSGVCGLRGTYAAHNSLLLVKCAVMHCHRGLASGSVCIYVCTHLCTYVQYVTYNISLETAQ